MLRAYQLAEQGYRPKEIERTIGVSDWTVTKWLRRPEKFSPYPDEVALRRALQGDRGVFNRLSMWELREFYLRVWRWAESERLYNGGMNLPPGEPTVYTMLAPQLGLTVKQLKDRIHAMRARTA